MSSSTHSFAQARAAPAELEIEQYLHRYIPLSVALGVRVKDATPARVELTAPLAPNVNHHDTVFGGSAAAVATLSAWTLVHIGLRHASVDAVTVIQRNTMSFEEPIYGDFSAVCTLGDDTAWRRFLKTLERRSRGRITMKAHLLFNSRPVASFEGDFVAMRK